LLDDEQTPRTVAGVRQKHRAVEAADHRRQPQIERHSGIACGAQDECEQ
jgi:hypothetical protein